MLKPAAPKTGKSRLGTGTIWDVGTVQEDTDYRHWWTVLDCEGRLLLAPGFRFVNRFAFVRCAKPWTDMDAQ